MAAGYRPGEVFLPKIDAPCDLDDIVVELVRADSEAAANASASVRGRVVADGKPCDDGWVGIWYPQREADTLNVALCRGCPVPRPALPYFEIELDTDGSFAFDGVPPDTPALLVVAVPGRAPHVQELPLHRDLQAPLEIALQPGATICGQVTDVPERMRGRLFVVAFDQHIVRREVRVAADGSFAVSDLPPGTYGLRVGHDDQELLDDAWPDVSSGGLFGSSTAKPWSGVERLRVEAGETRTDVKVPYVQNPKQR